MKYFKLFVALFTLLWNSSESWKIPNKAPVPQGYSLDQEDIPVHTECGGLIDIYDHKPVMIELISERGLPHYLFCVWTLRVNTRGGRKPTNIAIQLETDLNENNYDGLTFYSWNGTSLSGSKLEKYGSLIAETSEGFLTYTTDVNAASTGFRAYVSAISTIGSGNVPSSHHASTENGTLSYPANEDQNEYGNNERASFVIPIPNSGCRNYQTNLTIRDVDIETKYDYLEVYSLEPYHSKEGSRHVLQTTISGTYPDVAALITTYRPLLLLFYSDDGKVGTGFTLDWSSKELPCNVHPQISRMKE